MLMFGDFSCFVNLYLRFLFIFGQCEYLPIISWKVEKPKVDSLTWTKSWKFQNMHENHENCKTVTKIMKNSKMCTKSWKIPKHVQNHENSKTCAKSWKISKHVQNHKKLSRVNIFLLHKYFFIFCWKVEKPKVHFYPTLWA